MLFLAIFLILNIKSFAIESEENEIFKFSEIEEVLETASSVSKIPDTSSKHIIAIDRNSNRILFEKDAFSKTPMASTTKILTSIIAIEKCNLDESVNISNTASTISGSTLGIISNTKMSMNDLLYGLMLKSGNDCAVAIAEHIGGTVNEFCNVMNTKVKEMGLKNTNFTSPHGLDDDNHYTTAYELALITNYALNNKTFQKIVGTKETTVQIRHTF